MIYIIEALAESDIPEMFPPVHSRTQKRLHKYGILERMPGNVRLKPMGYLDMLMLMANSKKILTDFRGIQKETYMLGVPCNTLMENTKWMEMLEGGWNVLVGGGHKFGIIEVIGRLPVGKQIKIFNIEKASRNILSAINDISDGFI